MTVMSRITDPRNRRTLPHDAEPALGDLMDDATLQTLMARDGVDRAALEALIGETRRKLGFRPWTAASAFEAALFAECRPN